MGQVAISINGQNYQITCDDGQEEHLRSLAQIVDSRVEELVSAVGQVGDMRLLVMASLLLADEVAETKEEVDAMRATAAEADRTAPLAEAQLANGFEALAARIETIAASLEQS
ncbi:MAG TPA: cell division protein ZapA [Alphaproteobacteria bacterium]|nr:cell division protein ZapA [Alphaproteobacteria bacterium]